MEKADKAEVRVVVDNVALDPRLVTEYGLAIHIRVWNGGSEKNLFFDVSGSPWALIHNAKLMGIDLGSVDYIVISHMHRDHYAALTALGNLLHPRRVYLPEPRGVSTRVSEVLEGVEVERTVYLRGRVVIAPGVTVFGPVGSSGEVSVLLDAGDYTLLLVACGHAPLKQVLYWAGRSYYDIVMGGFHLKNATREYVEEIGGILWKKAGVTIGLHCSHWGSWLLSRLLGTRYVEGGAGLRIVVEPGFLRCDPRPSL